MKFWKRRKSKPKDQDVEQWRERFKETAGKRLQKAIDDEVEKNIKDVIPRADCRRTKGLYQETANQIAANMDHQGRTKNEVLAIAYQRVHDILSLDNTRIEDHFREERFKNICFVYENNHGIRRTSFAPQSTANTSMYSCFSMLDHITQYDKQAYLNAHKNVITSTIKGLETKVQQARQRLVEKQQLTEHTESRIRDIQGKQQVREDELDGQLAAVQAQIEKVQQALTLQKNQPKSKHSPDMDRLESMLTELRRLK